MFLCMLNGGVIYVLCTEYELCRYLELVTRGTIVLPLREQVSFKPYDAVYGYGTREVFLFPMDRSLRPAFVPAPGKETRTSERGQQKKKPIFHPSL